MTTTTINVELAFPGKEYAMKVVRRKDLGLSSSSGSEFWSEERENIEMAWEELLQLTLASKYNILADYFETLTKK